MGMHERWMVLGCAGLVPLLGALWFGLASSGCRTEAAEAREIVTSVAALTPEAPSPVPSPVDFAPTRVVCPEVERQARELQALLPQQLDADTLATGVSSHGCDLTLEYQLLTLTAQDVTEKGLRAMRSRVSDQLCADRGALAVMHRGGRFTNIYYDRGHTQIGLFSVAAEDCGI